MKSTQIRVSKQDKDLWKKYCEIVGDSSPKLFNKIIKSKELNLNQRILNEFRKKKQQILGGLYE
jgi:hypothetical protein